MGDALNVILTVNPHELQIGDSCELNYSMDLVNGKEVAQTILNITGGKK